MRNAWGGLSSKSGGETSYLGVEGSNVEVNQPLGEGMRPLMRQGLRSNAREHFPSPYFLPVRQNRPRLSR